MKISALASLLLAGMALAAEPVKTTAKLPEDSIILTGPERDGELKVTGKFKSDTVISEIVQGNWIRTEHLVTYELSAPGDSFPHKELSFTCRDSSPSPESGIMLKKAAWPFREGSMTFWLDRDELVRHTAYFNIFRYESVATTEN